MQRKALLIVQAMICLLFVSAVGVAAGPQSPTVINFTDVPNSNPFYSNIQNITTAGIASGYDNEGACGVGATPCYRPNSDVTRGQMAKFVDNARIRPGIAISTTSNVTPYDALPLSSKTDSISGIGVYGAHTAATGSAAGVYGVTNSAGVNAAGVQGILNANPAGVYSAAVRGVNHGTTIDGIGVWGSQDGHGWGVYGTTGDIGLGVYGKQTGRGTGVLGEAGSDGVGVYGEMTANTGVGKGVYALSASGLGGYGVYATSTGYGYGVYAESNGGFGVYGRVTGSASGDAIHGYALPTGSNRYAGNFEGTVKISGGACTGCAMSTYQLDDPRDPANKILNQAAVASPDYLNIYNGNVTTDASGAATVQLPDYFQALNSDYRYQLTSLGQFAQAIVAQKIADNKFVIKTDKPNVEVSWQVTGVRSDAVAKANPVTPEQDKTAAERGYYLNPELYGQPLSQSISAADSKLQPDSNGVVPVAATQK